MGELGLALTIEAISPPEVFGQAFYYHPERSRRIGQKDLAESPKGMALPRVKMPK